MNAGQDSRARSVSLWRLPAVSFLALVSVFAFSQLAPLASGSASAASPTTTPPTTTTSSLVPSSNSSGCLAPRPPMPGTTLQYMSAGGDSGGYIQELPSRYTGRTAMPVVVDLHGYGVSAADMVKITKLGTYGNRDGFITITPQVARPLPYWKTGFKSKDVAFLRGVISHVESNLCVDQNRLFVTGYSNGAIMASVLACVDASQVAAIAPVSGIANPAGCNPSRPVSVVAFHGTSDPLVPYTGGLGAEAYSLPLPQGAKGNISQLLGNNVPQSTKGPSIPKSTAAWAKRDGCAQTSTTRVFAKNVALISYACPNGATVSLYRIRGGGHTWPGSVLDSKTNTLGATTLAISADKIIWNFFESHPLGP
ncbi:MAG TPA: PHB depolymerase family esterase [Acidimicrobiales bacterium]|nr:PHB depolymerase family esterase [Acidimicrobiales bacterium]